MKITLRQLEVFAAIAGHSHVTRAAAAVAMTQSAASMALADLEQQLGVVLFDRVGRQLVLNDTGRLLLGPARDVLDRARDMETMARGETAEFDLHLGATVTIGNHLVPGLVARLRRDYPHSRVRISRFNTEQLLAQVSGGQIDLGFIEGPGGDDSIRRLTWREDQLIIFAAPDHPLAGRGKAPKARSAAALTPRLLSDTDWIVRERGSGTREVMDRALSAAGVTPRIAFELEQPEAIRQCVKAGLGIGCLSALELEDAFRAGTLVPLATPFLDMRRNLDVVLHRRKYLSRGIAAILQECGIDSSAVG